MADSPITPRFLYKFVALETGLFAALKMIDSVSPLALFATSAALLAGLWIWDNGLKLPSGFSVRRALSRSQPELMPLLELRDVAKSKGWKVEGHNEVEILDLVAALNEAGPNSYMDFFARENSDNTSLITSRPRRQITRDEWANLQVGASGFVMDGWTDNLTTQLESRKPHGVRMFSDVHVRRNQVRKWFSRYAAEHRGKKAKEIAEREARNQSRFS